jgi:hypothetical protein
VLEMEGGDVCKGKGGAHPRATAARSLRIEFQCEANTEPLPQFEQVSEDNFCEYSFTMQTIHGCPTQCAKTNGKICNDIGKCAWDHDEESVRCACSQDSGLSEEAAVAISGQHDTHFGPLFCLSFLSLYLFCFFFNANSFVFTSFHRAGPYCDQVCPEPCASSDANHGFCEYDTDLGAARCFCNTGYEGATCTERSPTPAAQAINVPAVTPGAGAAIGVLIPVILIFIVLFGVLLGAMFYLGRHLKNVKLDPNVYRDPATEGGDGTLGHPGAFASACTCVHLRASACTCVHLPRSRRQRSRVFLTARWLTSLPAIFLRHHLRVHLLSIAHHPENGFGLGGYIAPSFF